MISFNAVFHGSHAHNELECRDVTEPAKIRIRRMRISCAKSVGCGSGCGFVAQSKLIPAIIATAIQLSLSYLKLNSYK